MSLLPTLPCLLLKTLLSDASNWASTLFTLSWELLVVWEPRHLALVLNPLWELWPVLVWRSAELRMLHPSPQTAQERRVDVAVEDCKQFRDATTTVINPFAVATYGSRVLSHYSYHTLTHALCESELQQYYFITHTRCFVCFFSHVHFRTRMPQVVRTISHNPHARHTLRTRRVLLPQLPNKTNSFVDQSVLRQRVSLFESTASACNCFQTHPWVLRCAVRRRVRLLLRQEFVWKVVRSFSDRCGFVLPRLCFPVERKPDKIPVFVFCVFSSLGKSFAPSVTTNTHSSNFISNGQNQANCS